MKKKTDIRISPDILHSIMSTDPSAFKLLMYLHIQRNRTGSDFIAIDPSIGLNTLQLKAREYQKTLHRVINLFGYEFKTEKDQMIIDLTRLPTQANASATGKKPSDRKVLSLDERRAKEKMVKDSFKRFIAWFNDQLTAAGYPRNFQGTKKAYNNYIKAIKPFNGEQLGRALQNALVDDWLISKNMDPLTPEYFLRTENINRYLNKSKQHDAE